MQQGGDMTGMDFTVFMDETEQYIRDNWSDIDLFLVKQPNLRFIRKWKDAIIANFFKRHPKMRNVKNHSDATLRDMAAKLPHSAEELLDASGVGTFKLDKYGKDFLEVLAQFE